MHKPLAGKNVAVLVASGFEEIQMTDAQKALLALGATVKLIGPESLANGWHGDSWGHYFPVDAQISTTLSADFDMLTTMTWAAWPRSAPIPSSCTISRKRWTVRPRKDLRNVSRRISRCMDSDRGASKSKTRIDMPALSG